MTELTLSHKIKALYQERQLASWERDFIADAYATSLGGNKPFHLLAEASRERDEHL
jgi:hypothetical protein